MTEEMQKFINKVLPKCENLEIAMVDLAEQANAQARQNAIDDPLANPTRAQALSIAREAGFEEEVRTSIDVEGLTPAQALVAWCF